MEAWDTDARALGSGKYTPATAMLTRSWFHTGHQGDERLIPDFETLHMPVKPGHTRLTQLDGKTETLLEDFLTKDFYEPMHRALRGRVLAQAVYDFEDQKSPIVSVLTAFRFD